MAYLRRDRQETNRHWLKPSDDRQYDSLRSTLWIFHQYVTLTIRIAPCCRRRRSGRGVNIAVAVDGAGPVVARTLEFVLPGDCARHHGHMDSILGRHATAAQGRGTIGAVRHGLGTCGCCPGEVGAGFAAQRAIVAVT